MLGRFQRAGEELDFLLDEEAGGGPAHRLRDGDHGGVGPVAGAEGVVDVEVAERGDLLGEGGVALLLLGVEAEVFEQDHVAGLERGAGLGDRRADAIGQEADRFLQQFGEPRRARRQAEFRVGLAFGPAEVRHEDQRAALLEHRLDARQRGADALVVGDAARVVLGHVEVHAHQHAPALHVEIVQAQLAFRASHHSRGARRLSGSPRLKARGSLQTFQANSIRSTTRFE